MIRQRNGSRTELTCLDPAGLDTESPREKEREDLEKMEGIYVSYLVKVQEEVELINQVEDYLERNAEE